MEATRELKLFNCELDPVLNVEPVKGHRDQFYVKLGDLRRSVCAGGYDGVKPRRSKCGPKTSTTWELARNADS